MKVGLICNPIAGVGIFLGTKGTDNVQLAWEKISEGLDPPVYKIINRTLCQLKSLKRPIQFFTTFNINKVLQSCNFSLPFEVCYSMPNHSTSQNTIEAVQIFVEKKVDLIIFFGGDGTASDVAKTAPYIPIIGIPSGVKIFSAGFLHTPDDLLQILQNWPLPVKKELLVDLDEKLYEKGKIVPKYTVEATLPVNPRIQLGKISYGESDELVYERIAERINEDKMLSNKSILVGAGSTFYKIFEFLNLEKTLLGIDYYVNGELRIKDLDPSKFDNLEIDELWVTPIGRQGHLIGRGNRQISPEILKKIGLKNLKVFSTPEKSKDLEKLYIDTQDSEVDLLFKGFVQVIIGYYESVLKKVE